MVYSRFQGSEDDLEAVRKAENATAALTVYAQQRRDVVLTDIRLPEMGESGSQTVKSYVTNILLKTNSRDRT